ncbi:HNH endonuclease [Neobacillus sp. FSL H8-0543]|uniref:HNH endonuclease n=1 Tax=Neobacillus sp. FSL H8-0543 TaxID=2954672 RepID=UPI003158E254
MGIFRSIGKGLGTVGGELIGGTVKLTGKVVGSKSKETGEWIEEVGESVKSASKISLDNAGQFIDGVVQGTYGLIKKEDHNKQQGLNDLKDSTGRTIQGIGSAISYTAKNAGSAYKGFRSGDRKQGLNGLKNLGKVVAVSSLAIGVVDLLDGADVAEAEEMNTRNVDLSGYDHPVTGVAFVENTVELPNGDLLEGTFPVFDSEFSVVLAEDLYLESDSVQFNVANETLYQAIQESGGLARELGLSQDDVQALLNSRTPEGFTWHHHEQPGVLQLVDEETHDQTGHTGGRSIWGGGSDYR